MGHNELALVAGRVIDICPNSTRWPTGNKRARSFESTRKPIARKDDPVECKEHGKQTISEGDDTNIWRTVVISRGLLTAESVIMKSKNAATVASVLLVVLWSGYQSMKTGWEAITTTFSKNDKPYGGGDFRIRGNQVISVKLSTDSGKSWKELNDGAAQGGYFDPDTNTQYALFAYTMKKRKF